MSRDHDILEVVSAVPVAASAAIAGRPLRWADTEVLSSTRGRDGTRYLNVHCPHEIDPVLRTRWPAGENLIEALTRLLWQAHCEAMGHRDPVLPATVYVYRAPADNRCRQCHGRHPYRSVDCLPIAGPERTCAFSGDPADAVPAAPGMRVLYWVDGVTRYFLERTLP